MINIGPVMTSNGTAHMMISNLAIFDPECHLVCTVSRDINTT